MVSPLLYWLEKELELWAHNLLKLALGAQSPSKRTKLNESN